MTASQPPSAPDTACKSWDVRPFYIGDISENHPEQMPDGWEPFAVEGSNNHSIIWLRRHREVTP